MSGHRSAGRRAFRSAGRVEAGSPVQENQPAKGNGSPPGWDAVERLIGWLVATRAVFPTETTRSNWISACEPGRRLMLDSDGRTTWVQLEHIRACWATFERRGRIHRRDVLEPGRHSALMMALFEQLPGVERDPADDGALVLVAPKARRPA